MDLTFAPCLGQAGKNKCEIYFLQAGDTPLKAGISADLDFSRRRKMSTIRPA
jgi:hypothetical protein